MGLQESTTAQRSQRGSFIPPPAPARTDAHTCDASLDPGGQYEPAGQGTQAPALTAPKAGEYVPPEHCTGTPEPPGQYDPGGHSCMLPCVPPSGQ